jgi:hypothetical protein
VQTVTFTSLSPGGTYYFKIYPFTNSGTAINYKTFPVPPQATGTTNAPPPTTYTWNQTSAASYAVSTNWTPERTTPALNDILVVDGSLTPSATLNSIPTQTIGQFKVINSASATLQGSGIITLTIGGGTGEDLVVETGSTLSISGSSVLNLTIATGAAASISGNMSVAAAAHKFTAVDASGITFNSGAVFTTGTGFTGNPFGTTNYNSVIFSNGSSYIFTTGSNPFGASAPLSVVVFQTGSLYKHQSSGSPSFSGRTYANFELNFATANISATGPNATSIDNLTITLGTLSLNLTGDPGHSIKGNISVAPGATLNFNPASAGTFKLNGTSEQSITVNGTFSTGANSVLEIDNAAGVVLNSSISMSGGWKFTNGLLTLGSNNLTLGASSAITGTPSASSMIVATGSGELRKTFTAAGSFTYPVGDNDGTAEYSPVTLTFTSGSYASAYAGVNLVNAAYPGSTGNYLNRYWNVTSSGMSGFLCDALFSYNVSDVTGNENSLYCVMITPPTNYSPANTTLHQLTASGLTAFGTFTGRDPFSGDKTLNIKVFLEGLYAGGGLLNQANNEFGPQFPAGVADQVTIVLYDGIGLVYTINNVNLSTTGDISVTIPATYSATYYIGIKHRNSIETATASPISFAGSVISYDFTTSASQAFGSNLQNLQFSGVYGIFGGDENQDGLVDSSDMIDCDNDAAAFVVGYISTDVNGDGIIDSSDMILIDNNSTAFVATNLPY